MWAFGGRGLFLIKFYTIKMNKSKSRVKIQGQLVGYYELSTTSVKLWDKEGRLLHNNNDIDDAFISKFFLNQLNLINKS